MSTNEEQDASARPSSEWLACPDCHFILEETENGRECPDCDYEWRPES